MCFRKIILSTCAAAATLFMVEEGNSYTNASIAITCTAPDVNDMLNLIIPKTASITNYQPRGDKIDYTDAIQFKSTVSGSYNLSITSGNAGSGAFLLKCTVSGYLDTAFYAISADHNISTGVYATQFEPTSQYMCRHDSASKTITLKHDVACKLSIGDISANDFQSPGRNYTDTLTFNFANAS
jgi:hypothetical protein